MQADEKSAATLSSSAQDSVPACSSSIACTHAATCKLMGHLQLPSAAALGAPCWQSQPPLPAHMARHANLRECSHTCSSASCKNNRYHPTSSTAAACVQRTGRGGAPS
eukprot:1159481-Pelagomonas_calceolata.AAC.4